MITIIVLSIIAQGYACFKLYKTNPLDSVLTFCLICYSVFWIVIPGFVSTLIYFKVFGGYLPVEIISDDYILLYGFESSIFLCVVAGAVYSWKRIGICRGAQQGEKKLTRGFSILVLIVFFFFVGVDAGLNAGTDYLTRNDASTYDENKSLALFEFAYSVSGAAAIYLAIAIRNNNFITGLFFVSLLAAALIDVIGGSRIAMLLPVLVFFARMHYQSRRGEKKTVKIAILSLLTAFALMPAAIVVGKVRSEGSVDVNSVRESGGSEIQFVDVAAELFIKFNSFSSGLNLIDGYGPGEGGVRPYIGSALVFLPRFIFPDRPVAGSTDGTIYGTPARLVPQLYMASESMNVGVSPFAIAVWQLGWFFGGVVLLVTGIINLILLQYLLSRRGMAYRILAVYSMQIPTFIGVFNSPDVLLKNAVQIGIVGAMVILLMWIFGKNNFQNKRRPSVAVIQ